MSWEKEMFKCIHTLHYTSMTHLFWMPPRLMSSLKTILETFQHLKNLVIISSSVMHYRSISLDQIFVPTGSVLRVWEASQSFPPSGMFWATVTVNISISWTKHLRLARTGVISVVVTVRNDRTSISLRAVNSVMLTTPPELLEEIIIILDNSSTKLTQEVDKYFAGRDFIRL